MPEPTPPRPAPTPLADHRCPACGKLLFRAHLVAGTRIAAWCGRCGKTRLIRAA